MESHAENASQTHRKSLSLDWRHQGQPLPTGLERLEAISSKQKVLQWLEFYVPSDPQTLAYEEEDYEKKIDKEQSHGVLEEDITSPVPSDLWEECSQCQESQDTSEVDSDQELFQRKEDKSPAAAASRQRGEASGTTPTGTGHEPSSSSWKVPFVLGVQAGACLLPSQPPADRSPSLTASHAVGQQQRQSLFRRALRAVYRAFHGTHRPREQEQQCPAPSARQVPGDGCSEPQQRPRRE